MKLSTKSGCILKSTERDLEETDADINDQLLSEGVCTQAPLSILSLSKNMDLNPFVRTKRKQATTLKIPSLYELDDVKMRNTKDCKMKTACISKNIRLNTPEKKDSNLKTSLKEDIRSLLRQAVNQSKRQAFIEEKQKSNSMKYQDPFERRLLPSQNKSDIWFVTMNEVESCEE